MSKHERKSAGSFSKQSSRVANEVLELGRIAVAKVGHTAADLREKGNHGIEAGIEGAKKAKERLNDLIAEHPIRSILIALGAGALLGFALRPRG